MIFASLVSFITVATFVIFVFGRLISGFFTSTGIVFLMAPGIMRFIPVRILAELRRLFTETISVVVTWYFFAISDIVSPPTTVWTTPETGGILSICPILRSSSSSRSFAQSIASILTPYLSDILEILSRDFTICFLVVFVVTPLVSWDTVDGTLVSEDDESHQIRMSHVSEI